MAGTHGALLARVARFVAGVLRVALGSDIVRVAGSVVPFGIGRIADEVEAAVVLGGDGPALLEALFVALGVCVAFLAW